MAAVVKHYTKVRRFVVFSEPSHFVNFKPQGDHGKAAPRAYARILDAAYGSMHAARKDVVVIGGNVHPSGSDDAQTTAPDTFLKNMLLPNGKRPRLDEFGLNPYTERPLDLRLPKGPKVLDFDDLDWLVKQLDRDWPGQHLKLFIGEFGWNTEHGAQGWLYTVSRAEQAWKLGDGVPARRVAEAGRHHLLVPAVRPAAREVRGLLRELDERARDLRRRAQAVLGGVREGPGRPAPAGQPLTRG